MTREILSAAGGAIPLPNEEPEVTEKKSHERRYVKGASARRTCRLEGRYVLAACQIPHRNCDTNPGKLNGEAPFSCFRIISESG